MSPWLPLLALIAATAACTATSSAAADAASDASDDGPGPADAVAQVDLPLTEVGAPADAPGDALASCPLGIVSCVEELNALKAGCLGEGVACVSQQVGSQLNVCYQNGVRINWDPGMTSVIRADGRTCYTVEVDQAADDLMTFTVRNLMGEAVIAVAYKSGWTYSTYTCHRANIDIADDDRRCGFVNPLPDFYQCDDGICTRP